MKNLLSVVGRLVTAGTLLSFAYAATAQSYPNKPIRFITPYAPGGATSVVARLIGNKLTENWGQQVVVDNRPGGNGFIGGEALAKAPSDGYTLMLMALTHVITPLLIPAPYDPINDFTPVASVSSTALVLVLNTSMQATTLKELLALAKASPGKFNYASAGGTGGFTHLATEMMLVMAGIKMHHIPYKGAGPVVADLIGGQVDLHLGTSAALVPHIKNGRLKAIAVSGQARMPALPQVPTFIEAGLPDYSATSWYGILAPSRTPMAIVNKLSGEVAKYVTLSDVREKLLGLGMEPLALGPQQFAEMMKADSVRYAKVIKFANIKVN